MSEMLIKKKVEIGVRVDRENESLCARGCKFLVFNESVPYGKCKLFSLLKGHEKILEIESIADRRTDEEFRPKRCKECLKIFGIP